MRNVNEISDEQLFKCMRDLLDNPTRYHHEYLQLLTSDYERRVKERIEHHGGYPKNYIPDFKHTPPPPPMPPRREFINIETSKSV